MKAWPVSLALLFFGYNAAFSQKMDNAQLGEILELFADTLVGNHGNWQMLIEDVPMFCITDQFANRMRIVAPIKKADEASPEEIMACMEANFHTSLDVRYSISDEIIWSAFIHPLSELSKAQVVDAIAQIFAAVKTYGTDYTSTQFVFPKKEKKEKREIKRN